MHANTPSRCSHPRGPSIPAPAGRAAPAQAVESAILTPAVPAPQRRQKSAGCARKAAPRRAARACRRTPLFRVNSADAAVVAALPPACSDCACLSVVPDKQRLCTPVVGSLTSEATALTLLRISFHCHFSSLQLTGGSPAIANTALYNSQEVCTLEPHGLVAYIFMHIPLRYRRARQLDGGRPTNKQARRPTKKRAHAAANKR